MTPLVKNASERPRIVAIYAPSGAGKSQLAKATANELGVEMASRVPVDYFFVPRPLTMPMSEFNRQPLRYDWDLLRHHLALPLGTSMTAPDADFTSFTRRADTGGVAFTIRPVMLLDAMVPYPDADLFVRIDVDDEIRLERIRERDVRWGSDVASRTGHLDTTWASVPASTVPHLILDGTQPLGENATRLADVILGEYQYHVRYSV